MTIVPTEVQGVMPRDADPLLLHAVIRQASSPEQRTGRNRVGCHVQPPAHSMPIKKPPGRAHSGKGRLHYALNLGASEPPVRRAKAHDGKIVAADAGTPPYR